MVTDNGAVATAEATEEATPQAEVEPVIPSQGAEQNQDAGATGAQEIESTGTSEGEIDFGSIFEAALTEARGGEPATPSEPAKLPGTSFEEYQQRLEEVRKRKHADLRNGADLGIVQAIRETFGATQEEAQAFWNGKLRNEFNNALVDGDLFHRDLAAWIVDQQEGFSAEQKQAFRRQIFQNPRQKYEALIALGKQAAEAQFKADVDAGKYLPKATVDKAMVEAGKKVRGELEALYKKHGLVLGTSSPNEVNGEARPRRSFTSLDEANRAFNNNEISAAEWKREKDRFAPSTRS